MYRGIRKAVSIAGSLLLTWLFIRFFFPLVLPFLIGGALALAADPMVNFLSRRTRLPRAAASGIGVSATFCLLMLLLLVLCAFILRQLSLLVSILPNLEVAAAGGIRALSAWALSLVSRLPGSIRELVSSSVSGFFSGSSRLLEQAMGYLVNLTGGILSQVPDSALVIGTAVISSYMISIRLPGLRSWLREKIPPERLQRVLQGFRRIRSALAGWLKAQLKLMGLTWLILTMGLILLRIPYAPVWAVAVALVDAFPILGTGTVLLPWSLVCFLQEDTVRAVGLLSVYGVISLVRSALEPRLVGAQLGLDPLATLAALYAGFKLWGFGGMILAPVLAVAVVQFCREPQR